MFIIPSLHQIFLLCFFFILHTSIKLNNSNKKQYMVIQIELYEFCKQREDDNNDESRFES